MLLAYIGLIIGLILIANGILSFMGSSLLDFAPPLKRKGDYLWLAGWVLIGIAALLGWVGYTFQMDLRLWRIVIAIIGVVLAIIAWVVRPARRQA